MRTLRKPPPRATLQTAHFPAPTGGLNTVSPASVVPVSDCTQLYNMVGAEYGLRSRLGYREWATNLGGEVRSILPFTGSTYSANKLFATTPTGIWDVTNSGTVTTAWATATAYAVGNAVTGSSTTYACKVAGTSHASAVLPSVWAVSTAYAVGDRVINNGNVYLCDTNGTSDSVDTGPTGITANIVDGTTRWDYQSDATAVSDGTVTWNHLPENTAPTQPVTFALDSGYGVPHVVVTSAGHFLLYCDEANGYHVYTESTGLWAKIAEGSAAGQISGVNPERLAFVTVFKNRVWFVERESANGWYLDAGAIFGTATRFSFGTKFRSGGHLVGLWSWTGDGGDGIDDKLVAVSSGGDVAVYAGTDPDSATTFGLTGVWYAGAVPAGRNIATNFGGDMLLLSSTGVLPMSRLMSGSALESSQYATAKIGNLFNQLAASKLDFRQWSLRVHPEDNSLMVTIPDTDGAATSQLVMSLWGKGWSRYRDLPIYSSEVWNGKLYFGTVDGRICINEGYIDAVTLANPNAYTAVQWAVLTAFQGGGDGRNKQIQSIVATVLAESTNPAFTAAARYRYDFTELAAVTATTGTGWDSVVWDTATWSGEYTPTQRVFGAVGMGRQFAIALRGAATSRTVLTEIDVHYTTGGVL